MVSYKELIQTEVLISEINNSLNKIDAICNSKINESDGSFDVFKLVKSNYSVPDKKVALTTLKVSNKSQNLEILKVFKDLMLDAKNLVTYATKKEKIDTKFSKAYKDLKVKKDNLVKKLEDLLIKFEHYEPFETALHLIGKYFDIINDHIIMFSR